MMKSENVEVGGCLYKRKVANNRLLYNYVNQFSESDRLSRVSFYIGKCGLSMKI